MPRPGRSACAACWRCAPAGRILNPKSARSQVIGAMTMGVGAALMEEHAVDKRHGFFVNHDLASYEVPVHADIPHQEVIFLDETDPMSSPMKAKGVGELGICGSRRGGGQRDLQRDRRARARLSDHARQVPRPAAGRGMSDLITRRRLLATTAGAAALAALLHPQAVSAQRRQQWRSRAADRSPPEGAGGVFHRLGAHRLAVSGRATGPCRRRPSSRSSRCAYGLAHASAGPDADRHLGLRLGAGRGRHERGDSSR